MNILEFVETFPDEQSCREYFKLMREEAGIVCKKCRCEHHWWLASKEQWECTSCNFRTTLRSGTIMESSKLPIRTWFLAMAFMSNTKKGISASEMQRQLRHKRYGTVWKLMHKIRQAMGSRDAKYTLEGEIEFDEGYFPVDVQTKKGEKLKAGRGSQRQRNVGVLAESTPLEDIETGLQSRQCRYFKMMVLPDHQAESVDEFIGTSIAEQSILFSDQSSSYLHLEDLVHVHVAEKSNRQTTIETLRWVHFTIYNAKRTFAGIYHKIKGKYLQAYLDEFCFKLNRRYFGERLFERLVFAVSQNHWYINA
jgi:hypothetical protein